MFCLGNNVLVQARVCPFWKRVGGRVGSPEQVMIDAFAIPFQKQNLQMRSMRLHQTENRIIEGLGGAGRSVSAPPRPINKEVELIANLKRIFLEMSLGLG